MSPMVRVNELNPNGRKVPRRLVVLDSLCR
jgi:hypothetical protein